MFQCSDDLGPGVKRPTLSPYGPRPSVDLAPPRSGLVSRARSFTTHAPRAMLLPSYTQWFGVLAGGFPRARRPGALDSDLGGNPQCIRSMPCINTLYAAKGQPTCLGWCHRPSWDLNPCVQSRARAFSRTSWGPVVSQLRLTSNIIGWCMVPVKV